MKCKDCGAAKTTICHDEWWLCTNTYEAYRKDEIAALRAEISDATSLAYNIDPDRTEPSEMGLCEQINHLGEHIAALRSRIKQLEEAREWALSWTKEHPEWKWSQFESELKRRAGRER